MKSSSACVCAMWAVALMLLPSFVSAQSVEEGRRAANRGDFSTAIKNWKPLAEEGDPEAQYNLGRMYARGDGVRRDFDRARELFVAAAEKGNREAAEKLAMLYERGDGVERNLQTASYWRKVSRGEISPAPTRSSLRSEAASSSPAFGKYADWAQSSSESTARAPEPQFPTPEPIFTLQPIPTLEPTVRLSADSWTINGSSSSRSDKSPPKNLRGLLSSMLDAESGESSSMGNTAGRSSQNGL